MCTTRDLLDEFSQNVTFRIVINFDDVSEFGQNRPTITDTFPKYLNT